MTKKRLLEIQQGLADACEAFYFSYKTKYTDIIKTYTDAFNFIKNNINYPLIGWKESFYVIFLKRNNNVIDYAKISEGSMNATVVGVKEIALMAVLCQANAIILTHNHPSGNKLPSEDDIKTTQRVQQALSHLDISVLDHLILISDDQGNIKDCCSLKNEGYF